MENLLKILPKPIWGMVYHCLPDIVITNIRHIDKAINRLEEITEDCPACCLAALRQKNIAVPMTTFNYKSACADFWDGVNDAEYGWGAY
jgi:hypothetical protein